MKKYGAITSGKSEAKLIGLLTFILSMCFCFLGFYTANIDTVSKAEFTKTHNRLKLQIDSILRNCDSLKTELKAVHANTDTLKAGQEVIFKTMNENKEKTSIIDLIFK